MSAALCLASTTLLLATLAPSDPLATADRATANKAADKVTNDAAPTAPQPIELVAIGEGRQRDVTVRVHLPAATEPAPVVLFSHGLGGSRTGLEYLGRHLAENGFVYVAMQHPGSDASIWQDVPRRDRMAAMKTAATAAELRRRIADSTHTLDQLVEWSADPTHPLFGRLDLDRIGMAGHSYGARTTQAMVGQGSRWEPSWKGDDRVRAAAIFSPSSPQREDPAAAFASVDVPVLFMTGTDDGVMLGGIGKPVENRRQAYTAVPATTTKYQVVFDGLEHSDFSGSRPGRNTPKPFHPPILTLVTAFFDAHLNGDADALATLHRDPKPFVLGKSDAWSRNAPVTD